MVFSLRQIPYSHLPGWRNDSLVSLKETLRQSLEKGGLCSQVQISGHVYDFSPFFQALVSEKILTPDLIEKYLDPYKVLSEAPALFTGYYEPHLEASLVRDEKFYTPIYEKPTDLHYISDLGLFNERLTGERFAGRFEEKSLVPYFTRREIYKGALKGKTNVLAWVSDPVDFFFLQVQGSGVLHFQEGFSWRIGYSATNGHLYSSIGRFLFSTGKITETAYTMDGVKDFLRTLSSQDAQDILCHNPSYIFFERREGENPLGSLGLDLVPERSVAVDQRYIPLGLFLWMDGESPRRKASRLQKMVLAHDIGGAIKGPRRMDYYWGSGAESGLSAGQMKSSGDLYLLLPKSSLPVPV